MSPFFYFYHINLFLLSFSVGAIISNIFLKRGDLCHTEKFMLNSRISTEVLSIGHLKTKVVNFDTTLQGGFHVHLNV